MFVLRHGQSLFNAAFTATGRDPGIEDPGLTATGLEQAAAAAAALAGRGIRRIVASPFTRAMQTAQPAAAALDLPVGIDPMVRERFAFVCDVGSPASLLAPAWPQHDFAALDEVWWADAVEDDAAVARRAELFLERLRGLPDPDDTLLVSHWGFLMALTGADMANGEWREWPLPRR